MIFILLMIVFIWMGIRKGLLYMISVLFVFSVALYIGIVSTPQLLRFSPGFGDSSYYAAGCLVLIVVSLFIGLFRLTDHFFLKEGRSYFGKLLDTAGSTVAGFLTGYILWGFLILVFSMLPLSRHPLVEHYITGKNAREFAQITMTDVCEFVAAASLDSPQVPVEEKVRTLLNLQDAATPAEVNP